MIGRWARARGFRVAYKTREQIRHVALHARQVLGVADSRVNMIELLEYLLPEHGIHYHVVEQREIPGDAARAEPDLGRILIAAAAYEAVHECDPEHELLLPHEFAHFALGHALTFARSNLRDPHVSLEDSEVQADLFSHEFTMPALLVNRYCKSADDIQKVFNVPLQDARIRRDMLQEEHLLTW